jgi:DNA-binding response OmpR family regulator
MDARKYKVLVVDDDPDIREIVAAFLVAEGHHCDLAKDGVEALDKTNTGRFDAMITDFSMPRMNGVALASELLKQNSSFPVIIMTGSIDEVTTSKIASVGVRDFLYKPFSMTELGERFERMMRNHEAMQASAS